MYLYTNITSHYNVQRIGYEGQGTIRVSVMTIRSAPTRLCECEQAAASGLCSLLFNVRRPLKFFIRITLTDSTVVFTNQLNIRTTTLVSHPLQSQVYKLKRSKPEEIS